MSNRAERTLAEMQLRQVGGQDLSSAELIAEAQQNPAFVLAQRLGITLGKGRRHAISFASLQLGSAQHWR